MTTRALSIPIAELDATVVAFEQAVTAFEHERTGLEDALNGEWQRSISRLDALCEDVERRVRRQLDARLDGLGSCDNPDEASPAATAVMNELFDKEFAEIATVIGAALTEALQIHQRSYQALAARVRETAGTLLNVPVPPALPMDSFQAKRQSYWVGERHVESLSSLTVDGLAWLLPAAVRRRRQKRKFREAVGNALTRNISDLHWTMRQNIDDSFRGLVAAAREVVDTSIVSTRDLLTAARRRRQELDIPLQERLERACAAELRLAALHDILSRRRGPRGR